VILRTLIVNIFYTAINTSDEDVIILVVATVFCNTNVESFFFLFFSGSKKIKLTPCVLHECNSRNNVFLQNYFSVKIVRSKHLNILRVLNVIF